MPVTAEVTNCDNWTYAVLHGHVYCSVQSNSLSIIQVNFRF